MASIHALGVATSITPRPSVKDRQSKVAVISWTWFALVRDGRRNGKRPLVRPQQPLTVGEAAMASVRWQNPSILIVALSLGFRNAKGQQGRHHGLAPWSFMLAASETASSLRNLPGLR